jgi:two-component system chemotaxis response regulator CheY
MKALIVDDSRIIRKAIDGAIRALDFTEVLDAGDGNAALSCFEDFEPDLVTLDITMPLLDGLSCLERMLSLRPGVRIVVISALNDRATGLRALKLGAKAFIPKPFSREELTREIGRIFSSGA